MPSDMYLRGKHDAEADTLDESFYQYYYDYRLAYDEAMRIRRRTRRRLLLLRIGRYLLVVMPILLLAGAGYIGYRQFKPGARPLITLRRPTATPTATATPRPTLPPPTPIPSNTPTEPPRLRLTSFAVVSGTNDAPLRVHTAPGKDSPAPDRLDPSARVEIIDGPQQADGIEWWKVKVGDVQGWVAGDFLTPAVK